MSKLPKNTSREPNGQFMSQEQQQHEAQLVRQDAVIVHRDANGNHVEMHIPPASEAVPGEVQMAMVVTSHVTSDPDKTGFLTTWESAPVFR